MKPDLVIRLAALLMFLAVGLGARADAIKARLSPAQLTIWQTARKYHAWHALGLLAVGILFLLRPGDSELAFAALLILGGTIAFSGSLYALAFTGRSWLNVSARAGGLALLAGWLVVFFVFPVR